MEDWFDEEIVLNKRMELREIILELQNAINPDLEYDPVADGCCVTAPPVDEVVPMQHLVNSGQGLPPGHIIVTHAPGVAVPSAVAATAAPPPTPDNSQSSETNSDARTQQQQDSEQSTQGPATPMDTSWHQLGGHEATMWKNKGCFSCLDLMLETVNAKNCLKKKKTVHQMRHWDVCKSDIKKKYYCCQSIFEAGDWEVTSGLIFR